AAALVDLAAVGAVADHVHGGAGGAQGGGAGEVGRAVGAVGDDRQPVQGLVEGLDEVADVLVHGTRVGGDGAHAVALRAVPLLVHARLDGVLDLVRQLGAAAGEELDAVVGGGVVGGGDHHAEVRPGGLHQVGQA